MMIRNNVARLITVNHVKGKYRFLPNGPAVNVPQDVANSPFAKGLIDIGSLVVTQADPIEFNPLDAMTVDQLRNMAESLGIEKTANMPRKKLIEEIEKVQ